MAEKLLTAKWVLPISRAPLKDAGVVVNNDKITAVGPADKLAAAFPGAQRQDFGRAVILPGFVDLHTHLEFSGMRGVCDDLPYSQWKIQLTKKSARLEPEDWLAFARLGAIEAAQSGITTIADITDSGASLTAALELGLRGMVYYEITGMDHNRVSQTIDAAKRNIAAWQDKAAGSRVKIGVGPHSTYSVCAPLIKATSDWALADGLKVCVHLAGSKDEYDFVKYGSSPLAGAYRDLMGWGNLLWQPTGVTPVKYMLQWEIFDCDVLAVHCVQVNEDDLKILQDYDVAVAHCPKCSAKLAMGIAPLREFLDMGLRVGLGTDSPASNNTMDVFDEMRIGLLLQRGLNQATQNLEAETFVHMATIGGAKALGLEAAIGSLEPEKQADIVVVDMSHSHQRPLTDPYSALVYTANQENVILTMVGGQTIFSGGDDTSALNTEDILRHIEPIRRKLR
ncbi:MAG: amidohydrolase family protein [Actinomycetota bacterium]|nr:amidohydrolase family protein [Actinomycetota bacterium]